MSDSFFSKIDEPRIVGAIHNAEMKSRGEIRIHITEGAVEDAVKEAAMTFEKLGMTATVERNGVLIYIAPASHNFAVLGDSGITSLVGTDAWHHIAGLIGEAFRDGRFTDGLVAAIERAGVLLSEHFPRIEGAHDSDELPDTISRG